MPLVEERHSHGSKGYTVPQAGNMVTIRYRRPSVEECYVVLTTSTHCLATYTERPALIIASSHSWHPKIPVSQRNAIQTRSSGTRSDAPQCVALFERFDPDNESVREVVEKGYFFGMAGIYTYLCAGTTQ